MIAPAPSTRTLEIGRIRTQMLAPAPTIGIGDVTARIERIARREMPEALARALEPFAARSGPDAVWFIRRLSIELDTHVAANDRTIGDRWARRIAVALAEVFASSSPGANVVVFDSPADQLAAFLTDLARGHAWGHWYHAPFEGLRLLPASSAILTALSRDGNLGLAALLELDLAALDAVLSTLRGPDAARALDVLAGRTPRPAPSVLDATTRVVVDTWRYGAVTHGPPSSPAPTWSLRLFIESARAAPDLSLPVTAIIARACAAAASCLERRPTRLAPAPPESRDHRLALASMATSAELDAIAPIADAHPPALGLIMEVAIDARQDAARPLSSPVGTSPRFTEFGGALLLFSHLDAATLGIDAADWPDCGTTRASAVMRLLAIAACFGAERSREVARDGLVRDLLDVQPDLTPALMSEWLVEVDPITLAPDVEASGDVHECRDALGAIRLTAETPRGPWQRAEPAPDLDDLGEASEHARLLGAELDHLALPWLGEIGRSRSLALRVMAQRVARAFARRLPGFAAASIPHLAHNVLSFRASLDESDGRRLARLGRPPLGPLLAITGITRSVIAVPWLGAGPIECFPDEVTP